MPSNGIAVIDIALNHAFGRNPMVRMWMNDPDAMVGVYNRKSFQYHTGNTL
jgi:hypothetical protein